MLEINCKGEKLILLGEKAIYFPDRSMVVLSDTHFGKVSHFRKAGIAIPAGAAHRNLHRFRTLLTDCPARQVVILGDLFHSELNLEWMALKDLMAEFAEKKFLLVQGNHDILHPDSYSRTNFEIHRLPLALPPFIFSHEPLEHTELYNICGHIHPGVKLVGRARQSHRFPCFYFGSERAILPAFGEFTGLYMLKPRKNEEVYIISEGRVIGIK